VPPTFAEDGRSSCASAHPSFPFLTPYFEARRSPLLQGGRSLAHMLRHVPYHVRPFFLLHGTPFDELFWSRLDAPVPNMGLNPFRFHRRHLLDPFPLFCTRSGCFFFFFRAGFFSTPPPNTRARKAALVTGASSLLSRPVFFGSLGTPPPTPPPRAFCEPGDRFVRNWSRPSPPPAFRG